MNCQFCDSSISYLFVKHVSEQPHWETSICRLVQVCLLLEVVTH